MLDQDPHSAPPNEPAQWRKAAMDLMRPVPYTAPAPRAEHAHGAKINYFGLLWRRKYWVLFAAVLGAGVAFGWVILQIPVYRTTTTVEVVGFNEAFMGMAQNDPQAGTGTYGPSAANLQTQIQILLSPSLLSSVVDRVTLELTPTPPAAGDLFGRVRNHFGLIPQEPVEFVRLAIRTAAETTSARGVGSSRLIEISCQSPSAEVAASFLNTLTQEYITQNAHFRASSAARTAQWLEGQVDEAKIRMSQADEKLQGFLQGTGIAFVLDQSTLADNKLRQLQADLSASQTDRITKQSRLELARSSPVDSLPEILDDGTLRGLRDQVTNLRRDRAQLTATLTPTNPRVQKVDAQIAELEQTMQAEKGNLVRRIQNEYDAALSREKLLSNSYDAQSKTLVGQAGKAAVYNQLKRDVEMAQQAYTLILQQYNQTAVVSAVPTSNVRVVDSAITPANVFKPQPVTNISLGAGLGAVFAVALMILFEKIRQRGLARVFATPGLMGPELNLPELAVIPAFRSGAVPRYTLGTFGMPKRIGSNGKGADLAAWAAPSHVTESFRYALTSLTSRQLRRSHSLIVVTSADPGEGKTALCGNLAAATAETGRRVLVLDADLRRPRLHRVFDLELQKGFKEILQSETPIEDLDLSEFIQPTAIPGVSLLGSGLSATVSVGAIMFSPRLPLLFEKVREQFDLVLVDTAPALRFSDARLLARLSDGVILVVRSGVTFRESAAAVAQRFLEDQILVLGTILNDWDPSQANDTNYSKHYRYPQEYYQSKS